MNANLLKIVENLGFSEKAARIYIAALELGEATVSNMAKASGLKRTTIYYNLEELQRFGAIKETKRAKKKFYLAEPAPHLLARAKERVEEFADSMSELENARQQVFNNSRVYFLYGSSGFKQLWDKIFDTKEKEYRIITQGINFLDFVKEKYILNEIIRKKKKLGIQSRQLISDSDYARGIIAKDVKENRISKILPPIYKLPFTEIVCGNLVAFISPKFQGLIFIVEDDTFAKTRLSLFEIVWNSVR